jgi:hypothetical protein
VQIPRFRCQISVKNSGALTAKLLPMLTEARPLLRIVIGRAVRSGPDSSTTERLVGLRVPVAPGSWIGVDVPHGPKFNGFVLFLQCMGNARWVSERRSMLPVMTL